MNINRLYETVKQKLIFIRYNELTLFLFDVLMVLVGMLRIKRKLSHLMHNDKIILIVCGGALLIYVALFYIIVTMIL